MSDDITNNSLSAKFNRKAKDDEDALITRRFEALGDHGLREQELIRQEADRIFQARCERQIDSTEQERYDYWVKAQIKLVSDSAPTLSLSNYKRPLSPSMLKEIEEKGKSWLSENNKKIMNNIQSDIKEHARRVSERTLLNLENKNGLISNIHMGRQGGRGREI